MTAIPPVRAEVVSDLVVAGVTIVLALTLLLVLIPAGVENPGSIDVLALGPAFWPSVISAFLLLMGVIIAVQAVHQLRVLKVEGAADVQADGEFAPQRWASALALLAAYYLALDWLGMILSSVLTLALFMLLGGERRPLIIVVLAVSLPVALFMFFRYVANVFIPLGIFEGLFG